MQIFSARTLVENTWKKDVLIDVGTTGLIECIEIGKPPPQNAIKVDSLLPAVANLHSHAFQRAMAGMTEYRAKSQDSFWTWRTLMYRFLDQLTPEHIEANFTMYITNQVGPTTNHKPNSAIVYWAQQGKQGSG